MAKRVALLVSTLLTPHMPRVRALQNLPEMDTTVIELAASTSVYPWGADKSSFEEDLETIEQGEISQLSKRRLIQGLLARLESLQPDVIAITGYSDPWMRAAARWAKRRRRGVILMFATTAGDRPRTFWRESLKRWWIGRYVDAGLVGGTRQRAYLEQLGLSPSRIWEGYNVVDNEFIAREVGNIQSTGRSAGADVPPDSFLYVGRLAPEKNLSGLLTAYGKYREEAANPRDLVLVGDGPLRNELGELAKKLRLQGIRFFGAQPFEQLPAFYALARCLVLPSLSEPWGLVVNEAMASGLPVLVSERCGCSPDLIQEGVNGYTFDPYDHEQLAALLERMTNLSEDDLAEMGRASQLIIRDYSPERWALAFRDAAFAVSAIDEDATAE